MSHIFHQTVRASCKKALKAALVVATMLGVGSSASAFDRTFSGSNGLISYEVNNATNRDCMFLNPANGAVTTFKANCESASFSPNGQRVAYYSFADRRVHVANVNGTGDVAVTPAASTQANTFSLRWSPDGNRLAFLRRPFSSVETQEVYVINSVTSSNAPQQLTANEDCGEPDWAPDSNTLVYYCKVNGYADLFTHRRDGTGRTNITNTPSDHEAIPRWAPNGSGIAYAGGPDVNQLRVKLITTFNFFGWTYGAPQTIGATSAWVPWVLDWSPDSTKILAGYGNTSTWRTRLVVLRSFMVGWMESNLGIDAYDPALWSPDGSKIFYYGNNSRGMVMNQDGTGSTIVAPPNASWASSWQRL